MCPVCSDPMVVLEFDGIDIDWCDRCRGMWFDAGELALLLERHGSPPDRLLEALGRGGMGRRMGGRCPRCRRDLLETEVVDGVASALEECPDGHGIWCFGRVMSKLLGAFGGQSAIADFLGEVCRGEHDAFGAFSSDPGAGSPAGSGRSPITAAN